MKLLRKILELFSKSPDDKRRITFWNTNVPVTSKRVRDLLSQGGYRLIYLIKQNKYERFTHQKG